MPREPLPPVPNVIKAVVAGATSFLKNWETIFHWVYHGVAPTSGQLRTLAGDILAAFGDNFLPLMPPSTMLVKAITTDLSTVMMPSMEADNPLPGTSTADKLPANCALLYNWDVGMRYQGGHPRNYIYAGTDENLLNESEWNPAFITTAQSAMSDFADAIDGLTLGGTTLDNMVMVSYYQGKDPITGKPARRAVPLVLDYLEFSVNPLVGSQRRRIGRRM